MSDSNAHAQSADKKNLLSESLVAFLGSFCDELWVAIFNQIDHPTDLLSCILTCKRFKRLALIPLYHAIHYNAYHSITSLSESSFTRGKPSTLGQLIRTVVLSTNNGYGPFGNKAGWDGPDDQPWLESDVNDRHFVFNDSGTLSSLFHSSFATNITKVVLISARLPSKFHVVLGSVTRLRALYLYDSHDDPCICDDEDEGDAPHLSAAVARLSSLVDLRVWKHRFRPALRTGEGDELVWDTSGIIDNVLFPARHLHTLHLDWTRPVAQGLFGESQRTPHQGVFLTRTIQNIRILRIRIPSATKEEVAYYDEMVIEGTLQRYRHLGVFLRSCSGLEELHLTTEDGYKFGLHDQSDLAEAMGYVGLSNLRVLSVPALHFLPLLSSSAAALLESVSISHQWIENIEVDEYSGESITSVVPQDPSPEAISSTFSLVSGFNMKEVEFFCKEWHYELLLCVVQCFPRLKVFKVGYEIGFLSEADWQSMGAVHLQSLPELTTFYLYQHNHQHPSFMSPSPSPATPDGTHSEILETTEVESALDVFAAWNRYTKALNEVSFDNDSVWTRGKIFQGVPLCTTPQPGYQWANWSEWRVSKRSNRPADDLTEGNREVDRFLA